MCCDGFFSKNAFKSTNHLVEFLVNPMDYCHRSDFFSGARVLASFSLIGTPSVNRLLRAPAVSHCDMRPPHVVHTRARRNLAHVGGFSRISLLTELAKAGTCVAAFLKDLRVPLPDPAKCSMGSLFKFIYTRINDKVPFPNI